MSISINDLRFRIQSLLLYLIEGKSSMYIHSPKVFSFTENILGDKIGVELLRKRLKALDMAASCETQSFQMKDFGKEGLPTRSNSISDHHRRTHLPHRYAEIIFKIAAYYRPATVLELGTSTGTAAISLATAGVDHVITIDAERTFQQFASNFALREKISCIEFLNQTFDQALPALAERGTEIQLAFIDGNHRYEPTINYCEKIMKMMTKGGIIILDDIHWSKEMNQAWNELRERSAIGLSIDLYRMGILFLEEGKRKSREHFRLYYF